MEAEGATHMAIDRWLLHQHQVGKLPPTLRFYTWAPPAISLGYHQRRWPESWRHCVWQGQAVQLVRRPSGGRAVLHQGDLTYAIVASSGSGQLSQNRLQAYRQICHFLIQGFHTLGIELCLGEAGRNYAQQPNCFSTATGADLVVAATGEKLIGSAQFWSGQGVLQHGSIRLAPDRLLYEQVFGPDQFPALPLAILAQKSLEDIMAALIMAAQQCFQADFQVAPLTSDEMELAIAQFAPAKIYPSESI